MHLKTMNPGNREKTENGKRQMKYLKEYINIFTENQRKNKLESMLK